MRFLQVLPLAIAAAGAVLAQEFRATLSGRVMDPQEAVVAGVRVSATHVETASRSETVSGHDGQYTLPFLTPGEYRIVAEAAGFKRYVREGIRITTNDRVSLDITLEVGQIAETITISAEQSMIETTTASTGQVINARQIENMPMAGRTPLVLAQLAFGVIPSSDPRFYRPFDNAGPSTFSMGGAPARSNELLLDGAPDTTGNSRVAYNPPVDAVGEVKVETFQADAAYGHTGGGTVNVVMKSGTNGLHGVLYEFNQVSRLAATPFFTNRAGQKKTVTRYNQYGANAGGPVVTPRLFNGRNRLFFYFGWEAVKDSIPAPSISTVPTAAERNGDFSALLPVAASYQIYDPLTGVREGARIRRQPFPNNIIPANRINSIAKNYLKFYPEPNQPGRVDGGDNFLSNTDGEVNGFHNEIGRLDFNFSERHKMFYNFRHNERVGQGGNSLGKSLTDITATNGLMRTNWGTLLDDVYTFTPTTVLNTRLNWTRFIEPRRNFSRGFDPTSLGFPASLAAASQRLVIPKIEFSRFTSVGDTAGIEFPYDSFQIFSSLTKVRGRHSLKVGTDLRLVRESSFDLGFSSGDFVFGTNWTRGPLDNSTASPGGLGQDFAAFLLGMPTSGTFALNAARTNQSKYYALFLHDDLRVTRSLTLNLGIRFEGETGTTERYNRSVNGFDFTSPNPIGAQAIAAYSRDPIPEVPVGQFHTPGGLLFASPNNRGVYNTKAGYFSPRFGFAWAPAPKTAVRGGVGVFIVALGTLGINQIGFSQSTSVVPTLDSFLTPDATLGNPFPNGIERPTGSSLGLATFLGKNVSFYNPNPQNAYAIRWSLDIQREVARNLALELGYVGNHAVHMDVNRQLNFVPRQYLSTLPFRDQPVIDRLTATVTNPFANLIPGTGLNGSTVARSQLLLPYPEFTGVTAQSLSDGSSFFHMLQARLEKRFSHGLQFLVNYQYSKLLEKRSRLNDSDPFLEKRVSGDDRPQRFVLSASYDLPFGKGNAIGGVRRLIGGWIANVIYTAQPGAPLAWGNVIYLGGDLRLNPRNIDQTFDTTRFNTNSQQQLASNIRTFPSRFGTLRAGGVNNIDFSVLKNIPFTEKIYLQYRCEFFNGFNHPTFDAPNLSPTSSSFSKSTFQSNLPRRIQMALRLVW